MRITELNVVRFGILENFTHKFETGGINFIVKNNGEGKSTLANFIRAMFYGLNYTRSQDVSKSDVVRFTPWNSTDKFGGTLTFEDGGRKYFIERYFFRTQRDETGKITDLSGGMEAPLLDAAGRQLGERLFNLCAEEFMRCIFVPQGDIMLAETDFSARLSRLMEGDEESGEDALRRLRAYAAGFVAERGKGGAIHREREVRAALISKRSEAEERLARSEQNTRLITAAEANAAEVRASLMTAETEERAAAAKSAKFEIKLGVASAEVANAEEALASIPNVPYGNIDADVQKIKALNAEIAALDKKLTEVKEPERSSGAAPLIFFYACAVVFALLLVLYAVYLRLWLIVGMIASALASAFAGYIALARKKQKTKRAQILEDVRLDCERALKLRSEVWRIAQKYDVNAEKTSELAQTLFDLRARRDERLAAARAAQAKYETELRAARDGLAGTGEGQTSAAAASELRRQLAAFEREIVRLRAENTEILRNLPDLETLYEQIEQSEERENAMLERYDAAQKAMELLRAAKESLSCEYLPDLVAFLSEHVGKITGGRFAAAALEKDLTIKLAGGGSLRPIESFSCGIREAAMFCLRLALSQRIFEGEIPLMILDDPLVNLDGEKYARVIEILQNLASTGTQIIYFAKK